MVATQGIASCSALCIQGRKNCAAGCCACVDENVDTGSGGDPGHPGPGIGTSPPTFTQNLLTGITFPTFSVSGLDNIFNDMTVPTLPDVTGVSVESLKQNVTVPTVPAATAPAAPAASDSSMNWLWVLVIIPIGIAASAFSKYSLFPTQFRSRLLQIRQGWQ